MSNRLEIPVDEFERKRLRDEFAMAAMSALIAKAEYHRGTNNADVASNAYWYADAMLAEREHNDD